MELVDPCGHADEEYVAYIEAMHTMWTDDDAMEKPLASDKGHTHSDDSVVSDDNNSSAPVQTTTTAPRNNDDMAIVYDDKQGTPEH